MYTYASYFSSIKLCAMMKVSSEQSRSMFYTHTECHAQRGDATVYYRCTSSAYRFLLFQHKKSKSTAISSFKPFSSRISGLRNSSFLPKSCGVVTRCL